MVLIDIRNPIVIERAPASAEKNSLAIIEAAYDLESDDVTWLEGVLRKVRPYIDCGLGVYANFYEPSDDVSVLDVPSPIFLDCKPAFLDVIAPATKMLHSDHIRAAYGGPPCHSLSQAYRRGGIVYEEDASMRFIAQQTGVTDLLLVNAWENQGRGCCFAAALDRVRPFPTRTATVLSRVARHVAAAQRLRRSVRRGQAGSTTLDAEAVLDQRGAVLHAEGEAKGTSERELLASSTKALVGARERWRDSDPEQVAAVWNALVDGRWSLVDSFDRDGKRFLLARRNALDVPEPSALSAAERQVVALVARGHSTQLIAYELGQSASLVSTILQRALRKLRIRSRTELLALFNAK
jgi:DNA-binding CsgD family transcriptional regulator